MMDDRSALAVSYHAARSSIDPRTQVGAFFVNSVDGEMRASIGHNHPVRGHVIDWDDHSAKADLVHHAEEAAIYGAARHGIKTWGGTLYCPWSACLRCARTISGAKIMRIVGHRDLMRFSARVNPKWNATIAESLKLLATAGVECSWVDGPVDASPIRHAGFVWDPKTCIGSQAGEML